MNSENYYFQTLVEGGSIILSYYGQFFSDSSFEKPNIVIAKQTSVDVFYYEGTTDLMHALTIEFNGSIEKIAVLSGDQEAYQKDLLLIITEQLDIYIIQFFGSNTANSYYFIKQFNIMSLFAKQQQVQTPFYKKVAPYIDCCVISQSVRLVCFSIQESNSVQNQLLFIAFNLQQDIQVNMGFGRFYQNFTGLVTYIIFLEPLDVEFKKHKMLPQLLLHYQYNNRAITFDVVYTVFFSQFAGISFVEDGVQLDQGPITINSLSDHTIFAPIQQINYFSQQRPPNWIYFPLLSISFDRIILFYNLTKYYHRLIGKFAGDGDSDNYKTMNAMTRPLQIRYLYYPKLFQQFVFIASFDDGSLVHVFVDFTQNEPVIYSRSLEWPVIANYRIRMPTCTDLRPISWWNQKQHKMILFLGSQSVDTAIFELVGLKEAQLQRFRDKFQIVYGAIQDISVKQHGSIYCASSQGRDGSLMNVRFGYQLKSMSQLKVDDIEPHNMFGFVYKKQIYIVVRNVYKTQIFQYYRDNESYCQLFYTAQYNEINQAIQENPLFVSCYYDYFFYIFENRVILGDQSLNIKCTNVFELQDQTLFAFSNGSNVQLFDLRYFQLIQEINVERTILNIQKMEIQGQEFIFICLKGGRIEIFKLNDYQLQHSQFIDFPFDVTSFATHFTNYLRVCFFTSDNCVYSAYLKDQSQDIVIDKQNIKLELQRTSQCKISYYLDHIFIKSHSSLYYLVIVQQTFHFLPVLTYPLSDILNFCIMPTSVLNYVGIICNREVSLDKPEERLTMMKYPSPSHSMMKQAKYLDFMIVIITDRMTITTKDSPSYEFLDSKNEGLYLSVAKMNTSTSFSTSRILIKRSPVKVNSNRYYLVLLSEQYIGKMYLRFFDSVTHVEKHKFLLDYSISSDMHFLLIQGKEYFICTRFGVIDIHDRNYQKKAYHVPHFDIYQVEYDDVVLIGHHDFGIDHPCLSFKTVGYTAYVSIGDVLFKLLFYTLPFPTLDRQYQFGNSLYMKIDKDLQFPNYYIENITQLYNTLYMSKSGILVMCDADFGNIQEYPLFSDLKLIEVFQDEIILINYDNLVQIISTDCKLLASYYSIASISVLKQWNNKILLGTDTGGIISIIRRQTVFLEYLYNELIQHFENQGQKMMEYLQNNVINGDIIYCYLYLSKGAQEAISIRLNCTVYYVLDLLKEIDLELIFTE